MWEAFIKLVNKWAYRCEHNWDSLSPHQIYDGDNTNRLPVRTTVTFYCTKCMKTKKIIK